MTRPLVLAAVLALGTLLLDPSAALAADLDERLSLDLEEAAPRDVFGAFARMQELDLVLDPAVDSPITVRFSDITARTAITAICESIRCRWRIEDGVLHVGPETGPQAGGDRLAERIGIDLEDARLEDVFKSFASLLEARLELAPALADRTITIRIDDLTVAQSMDRVCERAACRWRLDRSGGAPVLRVTGS